MGGTGGAVIRDSAGKERRALGDSGRKQAKTASGLRPLVDPRRESGWPYEAFRRPRSGDLWQTTGEQPIGNHFEVILGHLEDCRSAAQADVLASLGFLDGKVSFARFDDVLFVRVAGPFSDGNFDRQVPEDISGLGHALWDMVGSADSGHGISNR